MATWRLPLVRRTLFSACSQPQPLSSRSSSSLKHFRSRHVLAKCTSMSVDQSTPSTSTPKTSLKPRWKPTCLYFAQGRCTKEDDAMHLQKFSHNFSLELKESISGLKNLKGQEFDYFLVLDLEGKVEILEFPVLLFDVKAMDVTDAFHRFVRPTKMTEDRTNDYIEGKYGDIGVDRVWHDTAIKFEQVIEEFEGWLSKHNLWRKEADRYLHQAAFVTCGNWDLKTKVPQQCEVSRMKLPSYFMEWINLKDVYLNFYNKRVSDHKASYFLELPSSTSVIKSCARNGFNDEATRHHTIRESPSWHGRFNEYSQSFAAFAYRWSCFGRYSTESPWFTR